MSDYLVELAKALTAPAIAIGVLGALGKWYLDRVLDRQTAKLEASLQHDTERFKASLANKVAVAQAKLQSFQQVSKAVYKARRACRDLHEVVIPQSEAELVRISKLGEGDGKALVNLVNEKNIALGAASLALEEQIHAAKEYLTPAVVGKLEQLLGTLLSLRSKVGEFFVPTPKPPTFATDLRDMFAEADNSGMRIEEMLVFARRELLDARVS